MNWFQEKNTGQPFSARLPQGLIASRRTRLDGQSTSLIIITFVLWLPPAKGRLSPFGDSQVWV